MSQPLSIELAASAARVASGSGVAVDMGVVSVAAGAPARSAARLEIAVTALAQVASLRLAVEHSGAASGPWVELDALDVTQTGDYQLSVGDARRWLRLTWALITPGASPSVTFSVAGEAHQAYLGPRDLRSAIREAVLKDITTLTARADACITVSDEADGYLGGRYTLPLLKWDTTLKSKLARLAIKYSFDACGWQPDGPDSVIKDNYNDGVAWLKRLQNDKLDPPGMVDSTPEVFDGGSVVMSRPRRGAI